MIIATTTEFIIHQGITFGSAIAIVLAWYRYRSIFAMILGGAFSWLFVVYFILTRSEDETPRHW